MRLALLVLAACHADAPPPPPVARPTCQPVELDKLDNLAAESASAEGSLELCQRIAHGCPLPARLKRAFEDASVATAESTVAKAVLDEPTLWNHACKGGVGVLSAATVSVGEPLQEAIARSTWAGCDVAAMGVAGEAEWSHTQHAPVALLVRAVLVDDGVPADRVRAYVRAIAQLPPR